MEEEPVEEEEEDFVEEEESLLEIAPTSLRREMFCWRPEFLWLPTTPPLGGNLGPLVI